MSNDEPRMKAEKHFDESIRHSDFVIPSSFDIRHSSLSQPLTDSFGRVHNNLRVSVTDRCNLRCTYCMPEDVTFLDKSEVLTFEEIAHFVRVATGVGIDKVRLTGGAPLLRRRLPELGRQIVATRGVR